MSHPVASSALAKQTTKHFKQVDDIKIFALPQSIGIDAKGSVDRRAMRQDVMHRGLEGERGGRVGRPCLTGDAIKSKAKKDLRLLFLHGIVAAVCG